MLNTSTLGSTVVSYARVLAANPVGVAAADGVESLLGLALEVTRGVGAMTASDSRRGAVSHQDVAAVAITAATTIPPTIARRRGARDALTGPSLSSTLQWSADRRRGASRSAPRTPAKRMPHTPIHSKNGI